jgi:hypothetical protein
VPTQINGVGWNAKLGFCVDAEDHLLGMVTVFDLLKGTR